MLLFFFFFFVCMYWPLRTSSAHAVTYWRVVLLRRCDWPLHFVSKLTRDQCSSKTAPNCDDIGRVWRKKGVWRGSPELLSSPPSTSLLQSGMGCFSFSGREGVGGLGREGVAFRAPSGVIPA